MAKTTDIEPLEAEKANYRKVNRPTKTRLAQTEFAVVMLAWSPLQYGDEFDSPADRDYEPFKTLKNANIYFEGNVLWAKDDFSKNGDMLHMILLVDETDPNNLHFAKVEIIGGKAAWQAAVREGYTNHPEAIFTKTKRERIHEEHKVNRKGVPKKVAAPVKKTGLKKPERRVRKPVRNTAAPKRQDVIKPRIRKKKKEQS